MERQIGEGGRKGGRGRQLVSFTRRAAALFFSLYARVCEGGREGGREEASLLLDRHHQQQFNQKSGMK
jgi:hypothetical protein